MTIPFQPAEIDGLLRKAVSLHQQGDLAEAESIYQVILARVPNHVDALRLSGVIALQGGDFRTAVELLSRTLALHPGQTGADLMMASALLALGRIEEALRSANRVLAIRPDDAEALQCRGTALHALARYEEALGSFDRVLTAKPDHPEAWNNRGATLLALGRPEEAFASHKRALTIRPDYSVAACNCGNALRGLGRHKEAFAFYSQAVALKSDYAEALNNRGVTLIALRRYPEAIVDFCRALSVKSDFADALNNRAIALISLNRFVEALTDCDRALALNSRFVEAIDSRGSALLGLYRVEEALASYGRALDLNPEFAAAILNRGLALGLLGRHEEAAKEFDRFLRLRPDSDYVPGMALSARLHCCDWTGYSLSLRQIEDGVAAGHRVIQPFPFLAVSDSAPLQLECAQIYATHALPSLGGPLWREERYKHDRIQIAYLSADFHDHATAHLLTELLETHDRDRFEVTALSFGPAASDEWRGRLVKAVDRFIDVRTKSDQEAALVVKELEIDIAVDLKGYTLDSRPRVLSYRAAPIQVGYLGYPGTSGTSFIDYIIADRIVIPEEHRSFYTEKIIYLPDTYQPNSKREISQRMIVRSDVGLPTTGFVFCCFNSSYKITPPIFDVWMRLLREIEDSVLWLLSEDQTVERNLRRNAEQLGVGRDRLVFAPRLRLEDHLARHKLADLFLDNLPINAHTTASDALWAGLPLVTCLGSGFAGRVAGSLLHAAGLPELITDTLEEYEALALQLARDADRLAAIKAKLARNRETCPLFDTSRFRRHIESAYETMWQRYQQGHPPASFAVAAG